jgi:hypothetical protein
MFSKESLAELQTRANKYSHALVQKFAIDAIKKDSKQNRW